MTTAELPRQSTLIPGIGEMTLPVSRSDLLLILVAMNEFGIGLESYLAHLISGGIKPAESIPVIFGPVAGLVLLFAIWLQLKRNVIATSTLIILGIAVASIGVGILGSTFHRSATWPLPICRVAVCAGTG
jgi:hypothetical protein